MCKLLFSRLNFRICGLNEISKYCTVFIHVCLFLCSTVVVLMSNICFSSIVSALAMILMTVFAL